MVNFRTYSELEAIVKDYEESIISIKKKEDSPLNAVYVYMTNEKALKELYSRLADNNIAANYELYGPLEPFVLIISHYRSNELINAL